MFKKDKKNNPLTGLHGQELIDAIKNMNYVKVLSPEQQREFEISQAKKERKTQRRESIFFTIIYHVKPIFFTPLSIIFHIITFVFRIIGGIASVAMIYGIYCACKSFVAWKAGMAYADNAKIAAVLIAFPFVAFMIAKLAELAWTYFENNKY